MISIVRSIVAVSISLATVGVEDVLVSCCVSVVVEVWDRMVVVVVAV